MTPGRFRLLSRVALLAGLAPAAADAQARRESAPDEASVRGAAECGSIGEPARQDWPAPLDRSVSLRALHVPLRDALGRLAVAARIRLSYSAEFIPLDRRVCVARDAVPAGEVLSLLLTDVAVTTRVVAADHVVLAPTGAPGAEAARSTPVLERVVVTGSALGVARRELPVALTVLDGRRLQAQGGDGGIARSLDIGSPGVWLWHQSFTATYPKVYIDGIEAANPLVLSYIAPETIERMEVIRGPQGAALYGTDAISGVINVVTRKDGAETAGYRVELRTEGGQADSDYASSVLSQSTALTVRGGSTTRSGSLAATYGRIGAYIPEATSSQVTLNAGGRIVGSRGILSATARMYAFGAGSPLSPVLADSIFAHGTIPSSTVRQAIRHYTAGATGTLAGSESWTYSATLGGDGYRMSNVQNDRIPIPSIVDASARAHDGSGERLTMRMSGVGRYHPAPGSRMLLTVALEHSYLHERSTEPTAASWQGGAPAQLLPREISSSWTNTGLVAQGNLAVREQLYLTGGARLERNGAFSGDNTTTLPMLGVAYVREMGPASLKMRAAYGKGIRPQRTITREALLAGFRVQSAIAALEPEQQTGVEAGLDIFIGSRAALQVTRFDQLASNLIQTVTLGADTTMRGRARPRGIGYRLQNVGEITNRGWELEGSYRTGPVSLSGTMTIVDSKVRQLARGYGGDLRVGDRMLGIPARTSSISAQWSKRSWSAMLGATRASDWVNYDKLGLAWAVVHGMTPDSQYMGQWLRSFWDRYDGVTRLRVSASRQFGDAVSVFASGENLLGEQVGEPDNITVLPGRVLSLGLRLRR
jgi:iron complex outermembrane recepter protein